MTDLEQKQKEQAIKILSKITRYSPIIKKLQNHNLITFSEGSLGATYDGDNELKLMAAVKKLKEQGYYPFHANHSIVDGMEMWAIMVVTDDEETWKEDLELADDGYVFCWVENVSEPFYSEFGDCVFKIGPGGDVVRIG